MDLSLHSNKKVNIDIINDIYIKLTEKKQDNY